MSDVLEKTKLDGINLNSLSDWAVRIYNNNTTPYVFVLAVLMEACGYDEPTANHYANKAHTEGSAICYWSNKEKCEEVARSFNKIRVKAEVIENK